MPTPRVLDIAIPIFDGITALDAVGPYEVLSRLPGARVSFLAKEPGAKRTENGMLALVADRALTELTEPDVIVVPGGRGTRALTADAELLEWLRRAHTHSTWTTSVCTGSLLLAAAGLLEGRRATTHWLQYDLLRPYGVVPVAERIVREGRIVTAAGVSAGIDMALMLAGEIAGPQLAHAIQLGIEYDPEPPYRGGTPLTAPGEVVELVRGRADQLA
jgi:transcriptional regulator GlxA family with amidase domain